MKIITLTNRTSVSIFGLIVFQSFVAETNRSIFGITANWFSSPLQSDTIKTDSTKSHIHCWLICMSTLGCLQVEYTPGDKSCKLLREIPEERSPLFSGASKQWHATEPFEFENVFSDKVISAGSHNSIAGNIYVLETWTFAKLKSGTVLRAQWFGSGGVHVKVNSAETYFAFHFNGAECSSPCTIDFEALSIYHIEFYWPFDMEGQCQNLPAGPTTIELVAKLSAPTRPSSIFSIAKLYHSHILVTELDVVPQSPIVQPTVQGYHLSTNCSTQINGSATGAQLDRVMFLKKQNDTVLLVTFHLNSRTKTGGTCTRWYVSFDGSECNFPGKLEAPFWVYGENNLHFGGAIGGVCENIPAGNVAVDVKVDACRSHTIGKHQSNYNQRRFFSVEEVTLRQTVPDSSSSFFNTYYHYWVGEDFTKNGTINASITTYNKVLSSSTLRIPYFGTLGSYGLTPGTYGSIWCFEIDHAQCSNSDKMCFDHWTAAALKNGHRCPFHLVGICKGLSRKKYIT